MSEYVNFYIGNKKPSEEEFTTFCYTGDSYSRGSAIYQAFKEVLGYNTDKDELALPVTVNNLKDIISNLKERLEKNKKYQKEFDEEKNIINNKYSEFEKITKELFDKNADKETIQLEIKKAVRNSVSAIMEEYEDYSKEYRDELKETEEAIIDAINFYKHYLSRIEYSDTVGLFAGVEAINPSGAMDDFE